MAIIARVQSIWTDFEGAPGLTTMYGTDPQALMDAVGPFWHDLEPVLPNSVAIELIPFGDLIDATSGELTGEWTGTRPGSALGSGGANYASPVGASIQWRTGSVVAGHRLKGRTFVVPLASSAFDASGALSSSAMGTLQAAATNLLAVADSTFSIWHRPPAGAFAPVTAFRVPDEAAVLRSRRD